MPWRLWGRLCRALLHAQHLHAQAHSSPGGLLTTPCAVSTLQCMHLFRDTSPVLLATGGASLSLIELHCR
jgi:hypothetical protein